jgi:4-hydroxy-4-methyl-2-oxoglutarate aldolase
MPSPASSPASSELDVAAELQRLGSATVGESGARVMRPRLRAVWPGARLAAPVFPVECVPGDNLAIHVAAARAPAGAALVVSVGGAEEFGYWGEVLTTAAQARQLAGLVIDGGVRDVAALEELAFPVFATMVALQGTTKGGPGSVGGPVDVGGVTVAPGDWAVADRDGVAIVPAGALDEVRGAAVARAAKETALFEELRRGHTTIELLGIDPSTVRIGH